MVILYIKYFDMIDIFFSYVTIVANKPYCLSLSTTMIILLWLLLLLLSLCRCYCSFGLFEKGGFTLKTHQVLSVHTTPKEFKNTTIKGHFGFVLKKKNSVREITLLCSRHRFRKASYWTVSFLGVSSEENGKRANHQRISRNV